MNNYLFNYYVISMKDKEREDNIKKMELKLGYPLEIFNGIDGNDIDFNLIDVKFCYNFKYKRELGCFLSHYTLYKHLIDSPYTYTVIFEDDFKICTDDLNNKIKECITETKNKYDFLFLGYNKKTISTRLKKHYYLKYWGFHAYVIKNDSLSTLIPLLQKAYSEIDIQVYNILRSGSFTAFFFNPVLVTQNNFKSLIRSTSTTNTKQNTEVVNKQKQIVVNKQIYYINKHAFHKLRLLK